jgi:hypothetical protein
MLSVLPLIAAHLCMFQLVVSIVMFSRSFDAIVLCTLLIAVVLVVFPPCISVSSSAAYCAV